MQGAPMDHFFYYGQSILGEETRNDLSVGLQQPKRSLFFSPLDAVGITEYENLPAGFYLEVNLKYDIVAWISRRNQVVSDGDEEGTQDRRVATSQSIIRVDSDENTGEVDVRVQYVTFASLKPEAVTLPIGGSV